jgi:CheY-like chemotaxis protein
MALGSILLIEDERINALAFQKVLASLNFDNKLTIHPTAEEGLNYLRNQSDLPDIIILDLNLPKMNGIDFLKIVKQDPVFKKIPVIVLTTSTHPQDKTDCFNLQVAGYFVKPIDYSELVRSILSYWEKSEFLLFPNK